MPLMSVLWCPEPHSLSVLKYYCITWKQISVWQYFDIYMFKRLYYSMNCISKAFFSLSFNRVLSVLPIFQTLEWNAYLVNRFHDSRLHILKNETISMQNWTDNIWIHVGNENRQSWLPILVRQSNTYIGQAWVMLPRFQGNEPISHPLRVSVLYPVSKRKVWLVLSWSINVFYSFTLLHEIIIVYFPKIK